MRRRIRLTEGQLMDIIEEATRRVIQETGLLKGLDVRQNMMNNVANAATDTATKLFQSPTTASAIAANRGRMAANQNKATATRRAAGRAVCGPLSSLGAVANATMDASQAARAGLMKRK